MTTKKKVSAKQETAIMEHDPLADIDEMAAQEEATPLLDTTAQAAADTSAASGDRIKLEEHISIADVAGLQESFQTALDLTTAVLKIDAGEVETLDGAGIQLLVALCKEANSRSIAIEWIAVSDQLKSVAKEVGLTKALAIC